LWTGVLDIVTCVVMVIVLVSNATDLDFEGQTKDYKIGIYCICVNDTTLRSKEHTDRLPRWFSQGTNFLLQ